MQSFSVRIYKVSYRKLCETKETYFLHFMALTGDQVDMELICFLQEKKLLQTFAYGCYQAVCVWSDKIVHWLNSILRLCVRVCADDKHVANRNYGEWKKHLFSRRASRKMMNLTHPLYTWFRIQYMVCASFIFLIYSLSPHQSGVNSISNKWMPVSIQFIDIRIKRIK